MENNDQITALAREYAGEIYPNLSDKIISLRTQEIKNSERLIRFLLRRYCLVEKEQLINHYNMAKSNIKPQYLEACQYEVGATEVLESLFPEIAKEVEELK